MSWRGVARRSLPYLVTAAAGFTLAYLLVALLLFPAKIIPNDIKVPAVVGMTFDDASRRLADAGFVPAKGEQRYHASAPTGVVLGQNPVAGAVEAKGARVSLDVSLGQRSADVPPVIGLSRQQAVLALEGAGLEEGEVTERSDAAPRGQVVAASPAPGTRLPIASAVGLVVSTGPSEVRVPDLVGSTASQARLLLGQVGLAVGAVTTDSLSSMPTSTIVSQTPAAGRSVAPGTRIAITVAGSGTP